MNINPRSFIESADIGMPTRNEAASGGVGINLDQLPPGVVAGPALIDFTGVAYPEVRAGVSLSMLFASRVATQSVLKNGGGETEWLASYTSSLASLGFAISPPSTVTSSFKKLGLEVHQAIIPVLTIAFGGAAVGPIILAALQNMQQIDANSPWLQLFEREARRFDVTEFHFAAAASTLQDTSIRYAIARLNIDAQVTSVLFFRLTEASANYESTTTTMSANNSLMAVIQGDLKLRLQALTADYIKSADIGQP